MRVHCMRAYESMRAYERMRAYESMSQPMSERMSATFLSRPSNDKIRCLKKGALPILSRSGRAMAHDEEQERHSAVKQKPVDSLKNTHFWVVAPRLEFVV